jgi:Zn-dependent M16 (insulinase) family peptidase
LANIFLQATISYVNQALKGVSRSHEIDFLERYKRVKKEDIIAVFRQYFMPLFDPASSVVVIVTASGRTQNIREGLTSLGFDVTQKEILSDTTG